MARSSIWIGIGVFILAMLVSVDPSNRNVALSEISFTGSSALAKKGNRPDLPSIFDTIEDLDLDVDDLAPDDDDGPDDGDDDGQGDD
jgi:hypothetical protein